MIRRGGVIAVLALIAAACGGGGDSAATTVSNGDTVGVWYRGTLDDGTEFDSNLGRSPLEFVVGEGRVIDGFDSAVIGMAVGETKTVRLEPSEAYGESDPSLIVELSSEGAPEGIAVGDQVMLSNGSQVTVLEVGDDTITVDANPPLAGQALTFEITIESIEKG
ncbi:MAG TPA: FKBP-type peptidyl-prolyl cis-trans isomerase [Acidimicrobiia bacterium]|nr:FKBP-type peptidyl-prolyl cis-trans isomerase [Acidimicrobiia bacterium]